MCTGRLRQRGRVGAAQSIALIIYQEKKKKKNAFRENPGDTVECFHPEKGGMLGNAIKEASQITSSEPAIFQLLSVVPVVFPQLAAVVEIPLRRPKLRLAHPRPNARQAKSCLVPGGA